MTSVKPLARSQLHRNSNDLLDRAPLKRNFSDLLQEPWGKDPAGSIPVKNSQQKNDVEITQPCLVGQWSYTKKLQVSDIVFALRNSQKPRQIMLVNLASANDILSKCMQRWNVDIEENQKLIQDGDEKLCLSQYSDPTRAMSLRTACDATTHGYFKGVLPCSIYDNFKLFGMLRAIDGDPEHNKNKRMQPLSVTVSFAGRLYDCLAVWRNVRPNDEVGFILKRVPLNQGVTYKDMPYQFVPWSSGGEDEKTANQIHPYRRTPNMDELEYVDLNGYTAYGIFIPFGRIIDYTNLYSGNHYEKVLAHGLPDNAQKAAVDNPLRLIMCPTRGPADYRA